MFKLRKQAKDTIPDTVQRKVAISCRQCSCHRKINPGDAYYFDTLTRSSHCAPCFSRIRRLSAAGLSDATPAPALQELIDNFKRLDSLSQPVPQDTADKKQELFDQLRRDYGSDVHVRKLLADYIGLKTKEGYLKLIQAKRNIQFCYQCKEIQHKGAAIVWPLHSKQIWCLSCARGLIRDNQG